MSESTLADRESSGRDPGGANTLDLGAAFAAYGDRMARFFARCGSRSDTEDLVSETFMIALASRHRFDTSRPVLPWLYGIAVNVLRRHRRHRWIRSILEFRLTWEPTTPTRGLEEVLGNSEDLARLREVVSKMPEPKRTLLVLREWEGLTTSEIAAALEMPEGSVHSTLHHARKELLRRYRQRLLVEGTP